MSKFIPRNGEKSSLIRNRAARYSKLQGRRPRILITRLPRPGSEQAVKSIAAAFADMGFDVDINLSVQSPAAVARIAADNDVHVVGIPSISSESEHFVAELLTSLKAECDPNIVVAAWMSVESECLNAFFEADAGNLSIFRPETGHNDFASQILDSLERGIPGCTDH